MALGTPPLPHRSLHGRMQCFAQKAGQQTTLTRDHDSLLRLPHGPFVFFPLSQSSVSGGFRNKPTAPVLIDSVLGHVQDLLSGM